jgi:hypothetical protein
MGTLCVTGKPEIWKALGDDLENLWISDDVEDIHEQQRLAEA